ncbi:ADP-ribosylglycohydrolase family protein [Enhygromyxa salina]|uniref:ADP-ribosyl-[dinitrogen reductase] glycohydrolase n=1 Tax=Enhygromyxa salina TaxID=215803 RepID=A0A2S9YJ23_9BACT|nr:ADP-ribosylglycohydrolase family protein [Enhygromyxa salina]PRQ05099.1 ADP-ribosyl-[dinitrogen reductase] glycohydrolase [Enhygromyxa salina]
MLTRDDRDHRIEGGLLGLLIGDALGVPYEFHGPADIPAHEQIEMRPPTEFRRAHASVAPGTWSDDGAQALCLLASLLERGQLELRDFGQRMVRWFDSGYLAVDAAVFDVGIQTRTALARLAAGQDPEQSGPSGEYDNGNGSLMRVLPLALWHRGDDRALVRDAMRSSLPTHGHLRSQLCCAIYCLWARRMLEGVEQHAAWNAAVDLLGELALAHADPDQLQAELAAIDLRRAPAGSGSGYVVDCLHSARLALEHDSFEAVVKAAVAIGNDTDTTAAVAGGLAGIRSGTAGIPARWRRELRGRELLDPLLDALLEAARVTTNDS